MQCGSDFTKTTKNKWKEQDWPCHSKRFYQGEMNIQARSSQSKCKWWWAVYQEHLTTVTGIRAEFSCKCSSVTATMSSYLRRKQSSNWNILYTLPQINPKHLSQFSATCFVCVYMCLFPFNRSKYHWSARRCCVQKSTIQVESTCHSPPVKGVGVLSLPAELLSIFSDMVSKPAIT